MKQLFGFALQAFEKTNTKEFNKWWFGTIGAFSTTLMVGKIYFNLSIENSIFAGIIIFASSWFIRFLYFLGRIVIAFLFSKYKESIYGDAIIHLNEAFSNIHYLRKSNSFSDQEFKTSLSLICDKLKIIFDKKTGGICGVSIKAVVHKNLENIITSDTQVFNLVRDKSTQHRNTEKYNIIMHSIFSNTCFNVIFDKISSGRTKKLYYINNDIPNKRPQEEIDLRGKIKSEQYLSTSYDAYIDELPYKSEIVCPIIPIINNENTYNLVGFICVDCNKKDAFDTKYDNHLISGVADGIYDLFNSIIDSQIKK